MKTHSKLVDDKKSYGMRSEMGLFCILTQTYLIPTVATEITQTQIDTVKILSRKIWE